MGRTAVIGIEPVIEFCAQRLAMRRRKFEIKTELMVLLDRPSISSNTMERILSLARRRIYERQNKPQAEFRNEALEMYEEIIRGDGTPSEKIKAQERIDKLMGLESQFSMVEDPASKAKAIRKAIADIDEVSSNEKDDDGKAEYEAVNNFIENK